MNILHLYEIQCLDYAGEWYGYFYTSAFKTIRNKKDVLKNHFVSDGLRFIIIDQDWHPINITYLNPFTYFWKKYVKKYFKNGWRVDWEKELKKYHKSS